MQRQQQQKLRINHWSSEHGGNPLAATNPCLHFSRWNFVRLTCMTFDFAGHYALSLLTLVPIIMTQ